MTQHKNHLGDANQYQKIDENFRRMVISSASFLLGGLCLIAAIVKGLVFDIQPQALAIIFFLAGSLLILPLAMKRNFPIFLGGSILIFFINAIAIGAAYFNGGMRAPGTLLFVLLPIIAFLSIGKRGAIAAIFLSLSSILFLVIFHEKMHPYQHNDKMAQNIGTIYSFGALGSFVIGLAYEQSRKKTESILKDIAAKAEHAARMSSLGEMAGGIAHEINNPLAIVLGKISLIKRELQQPNPDTSKMIDGIDKASASIERASKIIRGLKSFSRDAENDPFLECALSTLIEDSAALCQEGFQNRGIEFRLTPQITGRVSCRAAQISQILINLLSNSMDAIDHFSGARWVSLDVDTTADKVQIKITDCGNGIAKEIVDKMMQPFFTTKPVGKGTGLGLSISYGIAQEHGGRLFYDETSPNTRFVLELPLQNQS